MYIYKFCNLIIFNSLSYNNEWQLYYELHINIEKKNECDSYFQKKLLIKEEKIFLMYNNFTL